MVCAAPKRLLHTACAAEPWHIVAGVTDHVKRGAFSMSASVEPGLYSPSQHERFRRRAWFILAASARVLQVQCLVYTRRVSTSASGVEPGLYSPHQHERFSRAWFILAASARALRVQCLVYTRHVSTSASGVEPGLYSPHQHEREGVEPGLYSPHQHERFRCRAWFILAASARALQA